MLIKKGIARWDSKLIKGDRQKGSRISLFGGRQKGPHISTFDYKESPDGILRFFLLKEITGKDLVFRYWLKEVARWDLIFHVG